AANQHEVRLRLCHTCRDGAHTNLGNELHADAGTRVAGCQVVDELRAVRDRLNVMVRGRANEAHTGRRMAYFSDPRVHLRAGELAALAGLRALGHLDLPFVGVNEVLARDTEATRCDLLDGAAAKVAILVRREAPAVFAAFAGVALPAEAVHGNRERLVGLSADRTERHRARREAMEDRFRGFHFFDRDRLPVGFELEQPAERGHSLGLLVDRPRVLAEDLELPRTGGVLQLEHRLRIEEVEFAVAAPLVLAAPAEFAFEAPIAVRVRARMVRKYLQRDFVDANAADTRHGLREVGVDELFRQA